MSSGLYMFSFFQKVELDIPSTDLYCNTHASPRVTSRHLLRDCFGALLLRITYPTHPCRSPEMPML